MSVLKNKKILLGITGSIAAYKACEIIRLLRKAGAEVQVILTFSGSQMIGRATLAALSGKEVLMDLFPENPETGLEHISLSEEVDAIVIAPATANLIAKMAHGLADDLLSTTILASEVPILLAPAMNFRMWRNQATQLNTEIVKKRGIRVVEPEHGKLASLATGVGRMVESGTIVSVLKDLLGVDQDFSGKRILVTAGPTYEPIDTVRYISNRSSGKMGYTLAGAALDRGAVVTLVTGPTHISPPGGCEVITVETAEEMNRVVQKFAPDQDLIIMAAAITDFKPSFTQSSKIPKEHISDSLLIEKTPDIVKGLRTLTSAGLIGFSLETENGEEKARKKLKEKQLDAIVLNYANRPNSGFESDTNEGFLFMRKSKKKILLPLETKGEMAHRILSSIHQILPSRSKL